MTGIDYWHLFIVPSVKVKVKVKVRVNLSLYLTKHHAIKTYYWRSAHILSPQH
jgi:hypothetical protein